MTEKQCHYDYASKCDCSEDDKCGCTFPNNMAHDFTCDFEEENMLMPEHMFNPQELPDEIHLGANRPAFKNTERPSAEDDSLLS